VDKRGGESRQKHLKKNNVFANEFYSVHNNTERALERRLFGRCMDVRGVKKGCVWLGSQRA